MSEDTELLSFRNSTGQVREVVFNGKSKEANDQACDEHDRLIKDGWSCMSNRPTDLNEWTAIFFKRDSGDAVLQKKDIEIQALVKAFSDCPVDFKGEIADWFAEYIGNIEKSTNNVPKAVNDDS